MGLNAQLDLMAEDGKAAILASPQLSARNGATAEFLAGGELPYAVTNGLGGTSVLFKRYGIKMLISPKVGKNGVIRATIDSEVSSVDPSISTSFGPALLTRNAKTEFNLRSGETMVLAGLISRKTSNDIVKLPFLGDIPILGALFRSKRFQNDETELVVFVTPTVVDAQSPGLVERVERAKERLEQHMGPQPYLNNPLQPGRDTARPNDPVLPVIPPPEPEPAPPPPENPDLEFLGGVLPGPSPEATPKPVSEAPAAAPTPIPASAAEAGGAAPVRRTGRPVPGVGEINPVTARPKQDASDNRPYRVIGKKLALRVSPDINAHILDRMPIGAAVESLGDRRRGSWLAVQYKQHWGWAAIEFLEPVEGTE